MISYLIIFITSIISFFVWRLYKINRYWKDQGIPEVTPWPVIGNMWDFMTGKHFGEWMEDIYYKHDGRYLGIYQFLQPILLIKDLDLVKQVLVKDFDSFVDHKNFFTESKEPVFKDNLFSIKGEQWKKIRATLSPAFTSSKMKIMFNLIRDCAEEFTNYFTTETSNPNQPIILNMKDIYSRFTNDVIASCGFGVTCNSLKNRKNEFFIRGQDVSNFGGLRAVKFILYSAFPDLMNFLKVRLYSEDLINFFRDLVTTTVDLREKGSIYRPDMIHLLMEARKGKLKYEESANDSKDTGFATVEESKYGKDNSVKTKLTDDEFAAQVLVFFLAGFETSSSTLSFISYELAVNEDIQRKLQKEIDEYMKECKEEVTYEGVLKLKYLDMVITETLRLWVSGYHINRICSKPYSIPPVNPGEKSIELKLNDVIWIPAYAIHRDPKYYPNPTKFDPERFNEENRKNVNPYSYMPFGIGPRNCIDFKKF